MARRPTQQQDDQHDDDQAALGGPGDDGHQQDDGHDQHQERQQAQTPAPFDVDAFYQRVVDGVGGLVDQKLATFQPAQHHQQAAPAAGDDDFDTLFFTSPQQALEKYLGPKLDGIKTDLTKAYNDDRAQQQQDRAAAAFWDNFYAKHDDLDRKTDDMFVQGIMQANLATLSKITDPDKLSDTLADKTRESLLAVSRRFKGGSGQGRTVSEGGNGPAAQAAAESDDDKLIPISQMLRDRKAARRKAAGG